MRDKAFHSRGRRKIENQIFKNKHKILIIDHMLFNGALPLNRGRSRARDLNQGIAAGV